MHASRIVRMPYAFPRTVRMSKRKQPETVYGMDFIPVEIPELSDADAPSCLDVAPVHAIRKEEYSVRSFGGATYLPVDHVIEERGHVENTLSRGMWIGELKTLWWRMEEGSRVVWPGYPILPDLSRRLGNAFDHGMSKGVQYEVIEERRKEMAELASHDSVNALIEVAGVLYVREPEPRWRIAENTGEPYGYGRDMWRGITVARAWERRLNLLCFRIDRHQDALDLVHALGSVKLYGGAHDNGNHRWTLDDDLLAARSWAGMLVSAIEAHGSDAIRLGDDFLTNFMALRACVMGNPSLSRVDELQRAMSECIDRAEVPIVQLRPHFRRNNEAGSLRYRLFGDPSADLADLEVPAISP